VERTKLRRTLGHKVEDAAHGNSEPRPCVSARAHRGNSPSCHVLDETAVSASARPSRNIVPHEILLRPLVGLFRLLDEEFLPVGVAHWGFPGDVTSPSPPRRREVSAITWGEQ
jgi:hypothetical protein